MMPMKKMEHPPDHDLYELSNVSFLGLKPNMEQTNYEKTKLIIDSRLTLTYNDKELDESNLLYPKAFHGLRNDSIWRC